MPTTASMHASVNRQLLARLACAPDPDAGTGRTREHSQRIRCIRAYVEGAHARNETAISIEALITCVWCWPGMWLDHHLRLRALLVYLLGVWNGLALVPWADMNVPDFLWSPHRPLLGASRVGREAR